MHLLNVKTNVLIADFGLKKSDNESDRQTIYINLNIDLFRKQRRVVGKTAN